MKSSEIATAVNKCNVCKLYLNGSSWHHELVSTKWVGNIKENSTLSTHVLFIIAWSSNTSCAVHRGGVSATLWGRLSLKPVKCLAGEPIHNLLNIFVSEKLDAYIKFYESNKSFVEGLGLKHEDNLRKMKLLSFMQLAENRSEITFEEIQTSIQIKEEEVEEFMMDVITTKLVRAKLAQDNGLVYVSSTMHRTFGPGEWQQLHQLLKSWKNNIHTVKDQMHHVASAQIDLMHKKI